MNLKSEVVRSREAVIKTGIIAMPVPIRMKLEYRTSIHQVTDLNKTRKTDIAKSHNELGAINVKELKSPLMYEPVRDSVPEPVNDRLCKILSERTAADIKNPNNLTITNALIFPKEYMSKLEEPETYFNGGFNDVSRISDQIDINELLDDMPVQDFDSNKKRMQGFEPFISQSVFETPFGNLKLLLKQLFITNHIDGFDVLLSGEEIAVLSAVLERKLNARLTVRYIYALDEIKIDTAYLPKRRTEECYKFILKQAFKHLQTSFVKKESAGVQTKLTRPYITQFYKYYFSIIAQNDQIDLENFYLPLTSDMKDVSSKEVFAKTINTAYISLICKSPLFVADLIEYLKEGFMGDYTTLVHKKIDKIVNKWELTYSSSPCTFKSVESICNFIISNKKTKLPWFFSEVDSARVAVKQLVLNQLKILESNTR